MNTSKYDFVFNESKLNKMILSDLKHDFRSHVALQALSSPNFDTFDIIPLHLTEYKWKLKVNSWKLKSYQTTRGNS